MTAVEANFDGLIGPTHNYGGLSFGNIASDRNRGVASSPRSAVLEGLGKAKALADAGLVQGILPPQERPVIGYLRELGFSGNDSAVIEAAFRADPTLVRNVYSASPMWAANAATVSPSADTGDGRLHMTPANLVTTLHRSLEGPATQRALGRIFAGRHFAIHSPLPMQASFADEGAANHVRLCASHGEPGVEIFVYGRDAGEPQTSGFPARQTREAFEAIARRHGLDPKRCVFIRQSQAAIDAGAFHNDVVCVGTLKTLFFHEKAFADPQQACHDIRRAAEGLFDPVFVEVPEDEVPIGDAISSYLFNSQLLAMPGQDRLMLNAPIECEETDSTRTYCERLVAGNGSIGRVNYVDVRQSMRNGGGPACLRLRVVLTERELAEVNPSCLMDDGLFSKLSDWANAHYRDRLRPEDLRDPALIEESRSALDALTGLLGLGSDFYPFQKLAA
ncbi:N-succinylarginine dihydrolase [Hyphobacterium sp. HN65]|uniref:N-succinylarginine dihydrolase n=1 Tax=Hyphobacterium lacteum TaxID=3116575 RepID=A0ABU7LTC9_9PROT|nr:N-succinylarginine dihydrolase [Hyphobacterium sp. HN65]MEE2527172.1 N-succinylarginine dihydrolase [Hyphobacterium sp. HN65]